MEPQPEPAVATMQVCGHDLQAAAEGLNLVGVRVDDLAAFSALPQVADLQKMTLSEVTFSDAGWAGLLAGIRKRPRLTHLSLVACGLGSKQRRGSGGHLRRRLLPQHRDAAPVRERRHHGETQLW